MKNSLNGASEFQRVYRGGRRYEGSLITVFALPNGIGHHRLGVTASKKAIGKATERNRAKRLMRETFRLSQPPLNALQRKYDWVFNGRRRLLAAKVNNSQAEFERILGAVAAEETDSE